MRERKARLDALAEAHHQAVLQALREASLALQRGLQHSSSTREGWRKWREVLE
jgi:hypothetical protein